MFLRPILSKGNKKDIDEESLVMVQLPEVLSPVVIETVLLPVVPVVVPIRPFVSTWQSGLPGQVLSTRYSHMLSYRVSHRWGLSGLSYYHQHKNSPIDPGTILLVSENA